MNRWIKWCFKLRDDESEINVYSTHRDTHIRQTNTFKPKDTSFHFETNQYSYNFPLKSFVFQWMRWIQCIFHLKMWCDIMSAYNWWPPFKLLEFSFKHIYHQQLPKREYCWISNIADSTGIFDKMNLVSDTIPFDCKMIFIWHLLHTDLIQAGNQISPKINPIPCTSFSLLFIRETVWAIANRYAMGVIYAIEPIQA